MIDPSLSLSFSVQTNPGVYALLVGSGVSRAAGIPTGWEIVLDLLGKLAASTGQAVPDPELEAWYTREYGEPPDYSKLLDALAKTPSERQQLLRHYFEPNDEERTNGLKQPTACHRSIAELASDGFFKVIITTNFDRLIEKALEDDNAVPTVLSSVDQIAGALPLIHTQCCVIKLHGDYMDARIRNTPAELAEYPEEINELLEQVLEQFGLIVCGWSADWDEALRNAIYRANSRRFTTYWALRGEPAEHARRLIDHRQAQPVRISDADTFFGTIQRTVQSIQTFARPHPLSTQAAVVTLKRYLSSPEYRIQLADLIQETTESVVEAVF